jgi:hypothetical protein
LVDPSSESTIDRDFFLMSGSSPDESFKPVYEGYFSKIHWKHEAQMITKGN